MSRQIIVADDHPLFREAMKAAVGRLDRGVGFVEADSVAAMLAAAEANPGADLLLLDLNMPGAHGFNALAHVRGSRPELPVIDRFRRRRPADDRRVAALWRAGVHPEVDGGRSDRQGDRGSAGRGNLHAAGLPAATRADHFGRRTCEIAHRVADLTPQQFRVLGMLCAGLLNKQIAYDLDVSEATVKAHVTAILRKLGVTTRTQAVLAAGRLAVDRASMQPPPEEFD